jgi:hypothetical protein
MKHLTTVKLAGYVLVLCWATFTALLFCFLYIYATNAVKGYHAGNVTTTGTSVCMALIVGIVLRFMLKLGRMLFLRPLIIEDVKH